MKELTVEKQMKLIDRVLNMFVKPEFPEIYDFKLENMGYFLEIHIWVDGTDEEQEMEIEEAVQNTIRYIGNDIDYGINFHVEHWDWEEEI
jgi:hypothetical protein